MSTWNRACALAWLASVLGATAIAAHAQGRGSDPAPADYIFGTTVGTPLRTTVTGECVRTGYPGAGAPSPACGDIETAAPTPPLPLPAVAKAPPEPLPPEFVPEPLPPEFVPEPESADMVPVPAMTAAEFDDGIGEHTLYFDEEAVPAPGDGIVSRWENPDYAAELAAAEAQMARADLPPPAPPAPVPEPLVVVAQPAPPPAPRTMRLTLEGETHFGFNKAELTPNGREKVDKLVGELEVADYDVILITGHSDRIGTKAYNQKLSERRALNVKQYLTQHGIDTKRVQAKWVGAAEPVTAPGACESLDRAKKIQCLAPDRRVEVQVINAQPR